MAQTYRPAQLAPSPYVDTEASTNVPCVFDLGSLRTYWLTIDLVATPSNNVVVATGCDADKDGRLSFDEIGLEFGWDCGAAFVRGRGGEMVPTVEGPDTNGILRVMLEVPVRNHKTQPAWLYDRAWDVMKVTVRGVDAPEEHVCFKTMQMGTLILIR